MQQQKRSLALGFLAGALGGAVGTIFLNVFQTSSLKATQAAESRFDLNSSYGEQQEALLGMFEKAHTRTAAVVAGAVGLDLTRKQRRAAAPITEVAFGIICAGAYGAVAEYLPAVTAGAGTLYGAALFTGASEVVLSAIGYVPPPQKRTPVQHLGGLFRQRLVWRDNGRRSPLGPFSLIRCQSRRRRAWPTRDSPLV